MNFLSHAGVDLFAGSGESLGDGITLCVQHLGNSFDAFVIEVEELNGVAEIFAEAVDAIVESIEPLFPPVGVFLVPIHGGKNVLDPIDDIGIGHDGLLARITPMDEGFVASDSAKPPAKVRAFLELFERLTCCEESFLGEILGKVVILDYGPEVGHDHWAVFKDENVKGVTHWCSPLLYDFLRKVTFFWGNFSECPYERTRRSSSSRVLARLGQPSGVWRLKIRR